MSSKRRRAAFRDSLFGSSTPPEIVDAVSGTLGVLRSATVIRLEGGELWGWEGQHIGEGSCEGSCTHVWNYQQALASLFPALERSLRETEFAYNQLPNGGLTFRQRLPLGSGFDVIGPCADGHFGATIKAYREWRNSGDDGWLRRYWPNIRRSIAYAWASDNPDRWDPEKTGVLWGRQQHTLDMELFGPNSWLTSMYLAALKAAAEMARALGEAEFAAECEALAERGRAYVDRELFNGRYYAQKLKLDDRSALEPFDEGRKAGVLRDSFMQAYWSEEYGQIKYQIGGGCLTDQILGQWHADLAGLGDVLSREKVDAALQSIYRENFRPSLRDHFNPCRVYAYEDEAGLLVCSWPKGSEEPAVPVPYSEEVWTGPRIHVRLAPHSARVCRGGFDDRPGGAGPPRRLAPQSLERDRVRQLLRAFAVELCAAQRLYRVDLRPARGRNRLRSCAAGRRRLFLVCWPRLGRDRLSRRLRVANGQGRRAEGFAAPPSDAGGTCERGRAAC